jgi:hypothetical protein
MVIQASVAMTNRLDAIYAARLLSIKFSDETKNKTGYASLKIIISQVNRIGKIINVTAKNVFIRLPNSSGDHSVKAEKLVGCDAERCGDPVNGNNGQTVDRGAFQMADGGVAQLGLLRKLKLTHAAPLAEELDFEPDIFQKLVFFFRICFPADRHLSTSLRATPLSSLFYSLTKRRLHINVVKWYNIVVKQHQRRRHGDLRATARQNAPPIPMTGLPAVLRQPG